jgi:hypothetical protein
LDDDKFAPEDRIEHLWSTLITEKDWEEAKKSYDKNAWFLLVEKPLDKK